MLLSSLFVRLGGQMDEEFRKQYAKTVRSIAETADPFTKKRLLNLARRYDRSDRNARDAPPRPIPDPDLRSARQDG